MNTPQNNASISFLYSPQWALNDTQRQYFCSEVNRLLWLQDNIDDTIDSCLRIVQKAFAYWWHSEGRSPRSILLKDIFVHLKQWEKDKARILLGYLISMYHDVSYINNAWWYDSLSGICLETFIETSERERYPLITAGLLLDIDDLPIIPEKFNPVELVNSLR